MYDIEHYLNKITSAHCDKPNYMEWMRTLLQMAIDIGSVFESYPYQFSIDYAKGKQLDLLGEMFNVSRNMKYTSDFGALNDEDFRALIRAQVLKKQWDGTNSTLYSLWQNIYPDITLKYTDNFDMSIDIEVRGDLSPAFTELIQTGQILPVPMGVKVNYTIIAFSIPEKAVYTETGLFGAGELGIDRQVN